MIGRIGLVLAALAVALGPTAPARAQESAVAIFAGGCFWSIESDFDHAPGVIDTTSGYIGGKMDNPTYEDVVTETTGHREAVRVTYDPAVTDYDKLLVAFWHMIDPTDPRGQFCDFGESYTTGVFAMDQEQFDKATASKVVVAEQLGKEVTTAIVMAPTFWPAEAWHQNFWQGEDDLGNGYTRAEWYKRYREGCGKNAKVEAVWGKDAFLGLNGHA